MAAPDYLICLECDTPVYTFEWIGGHIVEAVCPVCGNDDPKEFASEEELEEMVAESEEDEED